ncbi:hypothetical protein LCGC14_0964360 [marine sediment metagenome]|uniref:Uncharacterized protein n=1 Tax=marine sediment metagenome TaxID=412755 RepID=A0A0F9NDK1_9ZZZZ
MQYILTLTRTTKNTYRYDHPDEDSNLRIIYVQQTMFPSGPPERITVNIEAS